MSNTAQLSARERITSLLDDNSFVEVGAYVTKRSTDFNLEQKEIQTANNGYLIDGILFMYLVRCQLPGGSVNDAKNNKIIRFGIRWRTCYRIID